MIAKCQRWVLKIFDRFCSYSWMIKKSGKVAWEACFFYIFEYIVAVYFLLKIVMLYFWNCYNLGWLSRKSGTDLVKVWSGRQRFPFSREEGGSLGEERVIYADINDDVDEEIRRCFVDVIRYVYGEEAKLFGVTALTKQPENDVFYLRSHGLEKDFKIWKYTFVSVDYYYRPLSDDKSYSEWLTSVPPVCDYGSVYRFRDSDDDVLLAPPVLEALFQIFDRTVSIPVDSERAIQLLQEHIEEYEDFACDVSPTWSSCQEVVDLDYAYRQLTWRGDLRLTLWFDDLDKFEQECHEMMDKFFDEK